MSDDDKLRARLDYYTKNMALHATLIVSVIFGLFSILRMITHFSLWAFMNNERSLEQLVLVTGYLVLVALGSYVVSRYRFYSERARKECRAVGAEDLEKKNGQEFAHILGINVSDKTMGSVFNKSDWLFAIFMTALLVAILFL